MFNALNKSLSFVTLLALAACGNSSQQEATNLLGQAQGAYDIGNYQQALDLIDSIKSAYPQEIEVRRQALHLSRKAIEGLNVKLLAQADSSMVVLQARGDSLKNLLTWVSNPVEGYYVAKGVNPASATSTTGLQARMSPDGMFYLISCLKGRSVKSTSVSVISGDHSVTTPAVAHDGERNDRSMGAEVITFIGSECDELGAFVLDNLGKPMTLAFNGATTYTVPLTTKQIEEIATVYDCALTLRRFKVAAIEKERLSRTVDIARSQAAETFVEEPEKAD